MLSMGEYRCLASHIDLLGILLGSGFRRGSLVLSKDERGHKFVVHTPTMKEGIYLLTPVMPHVNKLQKCQAIITCFQLASIHLIKAKGSIGLQISEGQGVFQMFNSLAKVIQRFIVYLSEAGMFVLLAIMLITVADIIGRAAFRAPILGSYEMTQFLLAIFTLLGLGYTQQLDGNVKVTLFTDKLPARLRCSLDVLVTALSLVLCIITVVYGWQLAAEAFQSGLVTDTLRIPAYPVLFLVPIGVGFLCFELVVRIVNLTKVLIRGS